MAIVSPTLIDTFSSAFEHSYAVDIKASCSFHADHRRQMPNDFSYQHLPLTTLLAGNEKHFSSDTRKAFPSRLVQHAENGRGIEPEP